MGKLVTGAHIGERPHLALTIEELVTRDSIDLRLSQFAPCTALLLRLFSYNLICFIKFVDPKLLGRFLGRRRVVFAEIELQVFDLVFNRRHV